MAVFKAVYVPSSSLRKLPALLIKNATILIKRWFNTGDFRARRSRIQ